MCWKRCLWVCFSSRGKTRRTHLRRGIYRNTSSVMILLLTGTRPLVVIWTHEPAIKCDYPIWAAWQGARISILLYANFVLVALLILSRHGRVCIKLSPITHCSFTIPFRRVQLVWLGGLLVSLVFSSILVTCPPPLYSVPTLPDVHSGCATDRTSRSLGRYFSVYLFPFCGFRLWVILQTTKKRHYTIYQS